MPVQLLEHTGTYTLLIEGFASDSTVNDFTFAVVPVTETLSPLTLGQTVNTSLTSVAQRDVYTFTLASASKLLLDTFTTDPAFRWTLEGPMGTVLADQNLASENGDLLDLEAGDYRLILSNNNGQTGGYSFRLLDLATAATPMTLGAPVTVSLSNQSEVYRFDASAGDELAFDNVAAAASGTWQVFDPTGQQVFTRNIFPSTDEPLTVLNRTGTYHLVVRGPASDTTPADFTFTVAPVNEVVTPLTIGSVVNDSLNGPADRDVHTFTLASPTRLVMDSLVNPANTVRWSLHGPGSPGGPGGEVVSDQQLRLDAGGPILDLSPGDYELTVYSTIGESVAYSFALRDLAAGPALALGTPVTVSMTNVTQVYSINVNAGEVFTFDSRVASGVSGTWRLIDPDGTEVVERALSQDDSARVLSLTGTYTLLLEGSASDTTSNDLTFQVTLDPATPVTIPPGSLPLTLGQSESSSLTVAGEQVNYTFTLTDNALISFDSFINSSTIRWSLTGPAGLAANSVAFNSDSSATPLKLGSGDYVLTVFASPSSVVGNFSFRLLDLGSATALSLDSPTTVSLTNQTEMFQLSLSAGDEVAFDSLVSGGVSGNWRLIEPVGNQVFSRSLAFDDSLRSITRDGAYTLLIQSVAGDMSAHDFTFEVKSANETVTPLVIDATVSDSLDSPADRDVFTFTLADTRRLVFDSILGTSSVNWTLWGPGGGSGGGVLRSDRPFNTDSTEAVLELDAGDYQITIDSLTTESYSFRLLDLATATPLTLGTPVDVPAAKEMVVRRFDVVAGERFFFDSLLSGGTVTGNWRLIDPAGNQVFSIPLTSDRALTTLDRTGSYTLLADAGVFPVSVNVVPLTETVTPIALGQTVTDSFDGLAQRDVFEFTATAGQILFFDGLSSDSTQFDPSLLAPDGRVIDILDDHPGIDSLGVYRVDQTGTHRLVVDNNSAGTGQYSFQLIDTTAATALIRGSDHMASIPDATRSEAFTFTGTAGDHVSLTLPGDFLMRSAQDAATLATTLTTGTSGFEDGYEAIFHAYSNYPFRDNASPNIILITDEDRDDSQSSYWQNVVLSIDPDGLLKGLNRGEVASILEGSGIALTSVVSALLGDSAASPDVLGVDADTTAYLPDGTGGVLTSSGGVFVAPSNSLAEPTPNTVEDDYVTLTWDSGGSVWDFEYLRQGGGVVDSFTAGFVDRLSQTIEASFAIDVIASDPNITITNLNGAIFGVGVNETVSFDVEFTGDTQPQSFDLLIVRADDPGIVLGSIPVRLNAGYIYDFVAADLDQDTLTYEIIGNDHGAVVDPVTGRLLWNPTTAGSFDFTVRVTDGQGGSSQQSWTVEVKDATAANTAPTITSTPLQEATVGQAYQYQVSATDQDDDTLRYQLLEVANPLPEGMTIDPVSGGDQLDPGPDAGRIIPGRRSGHRLARRVGYPESQLDRRRRAGAQPRPADRLPARDRGDRQRDLPLHILGV